GGAGRTGRSGLVHILVHPAKYGPGDRAPGEDQRTISAGWRHSSRYGVERIGRVGPSLVRRYRVAIRAVPDSRAWRRAPQCERPRHAPLGTSTTTQISGSLTMLLIFLAALLAFAFSLVLTPLCRNASQRLGLLDVPDEVRKTHLYPVSRIGGVPIVLSIALAAGVLAMAKGMAEFPALNWDYVVRLMPAFVVIFLTGLLDDVLDLKPWQKLIGQVLAAAIACAAGVKISSFFGYPLGGTWWDEILTTVWLVG